MYYLSELLDYKAITGEEYDENETAPIASWKRITTKESENRDDTNGIIGTTTTTTYGSTVDVAME